MYSKTVSVVLLLATRAVTQINHGRLKTTSLEPQFLLDHGSQRVRIPYGPYTVPSRHVQDGMKGFPLFQAETPCRDCLITWLQADLLYPNGTSANADTGLWLHHTVLTNPLERDVICPEREQSWFASGNERTAVDLCVDGEDKAGYYVAPNATFRLVAELMNMNDFPADVYVSITYEYIPHADDSFAHVTPIWLDIGKHDCEGVEMPAYPNSEFQYHSEPWIARADARIVAMGGHLHNGGTHLEIKVNEDVICDSVAGYGTSPAFVGTMSMNVTGDDGTEMEMEMEMINLSSQTMCLNTGRFKQGDEVSITAYYDTTKHTPMANTDGSLEEIMGISLVYFVEDTYVNATNGSRILMDEGTSRTWNGDEFLKSSSNGGSWSWEYWKAVLFSLYR